MSQRRPRIRRSRHQARVKLVGRALGFMELARDMLDGAIQLGSAQCTELSAAQENLQRALEAIAPKSGE